MEMDSKRYRYYCNKEQVNKNQKEYVENFFKKINKRGKRNWKKK